MSQAKQSSQPVIRPYPTRYVAQWNLRDGTPVTIRPIRPEDEPLAVDFYEKLSDRSVYLRYFRSKQANEGAVHEYLHRVCCIDYDQEMVLVAMYEDPVSGDEKMIAGARLVKSPSEAEFSVIVADAYQSRGLGTELCRRVLGIARTEGVKRLTGSILPGNRTMRTICNRLGFHSEYDPEGLVRVDIALAKDSQ